MSGMDFVARKEITKLGLWDRALRFRTQGVGLRKGFPGVGTVQQAELLDIPGHRL